jgi:hypothetical protein
VSEGRKYDTGKAPWHLLPYGALAQVVDVLAFGAAKYGPNNWQGVEPARERYFAATQRHLIAWWEGERLDPESGFAHLAHAACSVLFLIAIEARSASAQEVPGNDRCSRLERALLASEAERDALKAILDGESREVPS